MTSDEHPPTLSTADDLRDGAVYQLIDGAILKAEWQEPAPPDEPIGHWRLIGRATYYGVETNGSLYVVARMVTQGQSRYWDPVMETSDFTLADVTPLVGEEERTAARHLAPSAQRVHEKLAYAARILALSHGAIRERLGLAWRRLSGLRSDDLPELYRDGFAALISRWERTTGYGDEGQMMAAALALSDAEAVAEVRRLLVMEHALGR